MTDREKDVEILALRHQLTVLQRQPGDQRPQLRPEDRAFLAALLVPLSRATLRRLRLLVSPDTVLRWQHLALLPMPNVEDVAGLFQSLIADGTLPPGYATDDDAGLLYRGTEMVEALVERDRAGAYWVERGPDGSAVETPLDGRRVR